MNLNSIIEQIDAEITRLQQAKAVLQSVGTVLNVPEPVKRTTKRTLSPEARKAIGDAQRKRWKATKKAEKAAAKANNAPAAVHVN